MSYKYSKGSQVIGDLKAADDTERNTQIDFEEDYIGFETSGSAVMVVSGSKVGIGTTTPGTNLHVKGDDARIRIDGDTNSHPGVELSENGTRKWIVYNDYTNDNLSFKTDSNVRMSIEQGGNVGIGTTSPIAELDVAGKIAITAEVSTPSQPANGKGYLYSKSDGKLYWRSYDISETDLTATSGGGGGGGVTIPYPRLYFSGISPVSQIGNNSFTNATISTDNGKYENGFIDFGSSGNTAPARFETAIPLLGGVYTFSFWFYSKRTGSDWGAILRRESGGSPVNTQDYPILTEDSTDELGVYTESGGQFYSSGYDMTALEGATSWTHMAVVANGTNSKFYINGSLVGTANAVVTTSVKELGSYDGNDTQTFAEGIDDFAHWAEALSASQISEIYNSSSKLRDIVT